MPDAPPSGAGRARNLPHHPRPTASAARLRSHPRGGGTPPCSCRARVRLARASLPSLRVEPAHRAVERAAGPRARPLRGPVNRCTGTPDQVFVRRTAIDCIHDRRNRCRFVRGRGRCAVDTGPGRRALRLTGRLRPVARGPAARFTARWAGGGRREGRCREATSDPCPATAGTAPRGRDDWRRVLTVARSDADNPRALGSPP